MSDTTEPFKEIITGKIGGHIVSSVIEEITQEEIEIAKAKYEADKVCDHSIVVDTRSFYYDFRSCYICKKGLGTV